MKTDRTERFLLPALLVILSVAQSVASEQTVRRSAGSLFGNGIGIAASFGAGNTDMERVHKASLFAGRERGSLFALASTAAHRSTLRSVPELTANDSSTSQLLRLIGLAEAGPKGYDAVQYSAKILPPRRPTLLSIGEIYQWIEETPGQQHAIGRYQFIPKTLRRLVRDLGVDEREAFSPRLQDRLAARLLEEAGLRELEVGELSRKQFMNNLAKIWAGLPNASGKSHYHGYAGNRATMSWARFDAEMTRIFPG